MKFKLKKLRVKEGQNSSVRGSAVVSSDELLLVRGDSKEFIYTDSISELEVDDMVYVGNIINYIKTSPVAKILESTDNSIEFETKTSAYLLEEVKESEK